jgi:hypothetical protein
MKGKGSGLGRWLSIGSRTAHLCGCCGLTGGLLFGASLAALHGWLALTVLSGVVQAAIDLREEGPYLTEVRGAALVLKVVLLAVAAALPALRVGLFFLVVVLSSAVSHAPGKVRHCSLRRPPAPRI